MPNITDRFCCLHDVLSSHKDVPLEDNIKHVEQSLCLLGSVNCQFSTLREKKVIKLARLDFFGGIPPKFEHY